MGLRQVVVTGALDVTIHPPPLSGHLGVRANRLEFVEGGHRPAETPVMASATKASWIRTYSEREGLSLNDCYAYADSMGDLRCSRWWASTATNPDLRPRGIRAAARLAHRPPELKT
jgi:phosphoserine phosphatase